MDKSDSDGFFSRTLVCRTSDSSYDSTDSSPVTLDYQQGFLAFNFPMCSKTADHALGTRTHVHAHDHVVKAYAYALVSADHKLDYTNLLALRVCTNGVHIMWL